MQNTAAQRQTQDKPASASYFSDSLARGLLVIRAFDRDAPVLRIADVAKRTGLTRASARRFLLTLRDLQYVGCSNDLFYLRPRAMEIGYSYLASLDADRIIQPFLNELTSATRETSSFGVLDNFEVRLIARSASTSMLNFAINLGGRVQPFATALGRVLLAGVPVEQFDEYWEDLPPSLSITSRTIDKNRFRDAIAQARTQGWSYIDAALGEGIASIAVPIHNKVGDVVAAVNVVECPPRSNEKMMLRRYLPLLRKAAEQIEDVLGTSQHAMAAVLLQGQKSPGETSRVRPNS